MNGLEAHLDFFCTFWPLCGICRIRNCTIINFSFTSHSSITMSSNLVVQV